MSRRKRKERKQDKERENHEDRAENNLTSTVAVVGAVEPPKTPPAVSPQQAAQEKNKGTGDGSAYARFSRFKRFMLSYRGVQVFFSFCLVCFTLGQVVYGHRQWGAMDKQNQIMDGQTEAMLESVRVARQAATDAKNSAAQSAAAADRSADEAKEQSVHTQTLISNISVKLLRAYVSITPEKVEDAKQPDKLKVFITIRNSGMTRAHDLIMSTGSEIAPVTFGKFDGARQSPGRTWVGPFEETDHFVFIDVTPSQRESMKAGKDVLWIYGSCHYRDEDGNNRCTDYRSFYDWQQEAFMIAPEGNEADKCFPNEPQPVDGPMPNPGEPPYPRHPRPAHDEPDPPEYGPPAAPDRPTLAPKRTAIH
ncbi:MAG: hypothetical protein KGL39_50645 [Patescibacteria group bacterium]|nr:hypothetical protein [Patescibacteria group bacterium]